MGFLKTRILNIIQYHWSIWLWNNVIVRSKCKVISWHYILDWFLMRRCHGWHGYPWILSLIIVSRTICVTDSRAAVLYNYVTSDVFLMEAPTTEQYLTVKIKVPTEEVTCLRRTSCAGMQIERWRQSPSNRCQAPQPPSLCATEKQISEHLHPTGANGRDRIDRESFTRNVYRNKQFCDLRNLRLGYTVYLLNLQQSLKEYISLVFLPY